MASIQPPRDDDPNPNAKHDWFFMWIGLCLTRWGFVHEALYELCFVALGTTARNASILFYRTPNFESRLSLTSELVEACFPPLKSGQHKHDTLKEWEDIRESLKELTPIRNALAHQNPTSAGEVKMVLNTGPDGKPAGAQPIIDLSIPSPNNRQWMEVRLSRSEELRGRNVKIKSVRDTELPAHYQAVEDMLKRLWEFKPALKKYLMQRSEFSG